MHSCWLNIVLSGCARFWGSRGRSWVMLVVWTVGGRWSGEVVLRGQDRDKVFNLFGFPDKVFDQFLAVLCNVRRVRESTVLKNQDRIFMKRVKNVTNEKRFRWFDWSWRGLEWIEWSVCLDWLAWIRPFEISSSECYTWWSRAISESVEYAS